MNRNYFNSFVLPLLDNMFFYAKSLLGNETDSIDVVEEAILYWWKNRKALEKVNLVVKVMQKIRALAKDRIKQRKVSATPFENTEWEQGDWESLQIPHSDNVEDVMSHLPELHAEIICLRGVGRFSKDEISLITDLGFNNIRSILADARKAIRKGLDPSCIKLPMASSLLEKYYAGTTTLNDEEQLRLYFNREENREAGPASFKLFQYFMSLNIAEMPVERKKLLEQKVHKLQSCGWLETLIHNLRNK